MAKKKIKEAEKKKAEKAKAGKKAKSKKAKEKLKTIIVRTDGSGLELDAKEIVSVKVIPKGRPQGLEVADYIYEDGILRFPVTLPIMERVKIVYK
ncbi:MAG: hypothetical protein AB7U31_03725 [Synergistaceae bacterium]|jgi:hypothetical protein